MRQDACDLLINACRSTIKKNRNLCRLNRDHLVKLLTTERLRPAERSWKAERQPSLFCNRTTGRSHSGSPISTIIKFGLKKQLTGSLTRAPFNYNRCATRMQNNCNRQPNCTPLSQPNINHENVLIRITIPSPNFAFSPKLVLFHWFSM